MAKRKASSPAEAPPALFPRRPVRRRSGLFLGRYLAEEADKMIYGGDHQDRAGQIMRHWADLEQEGTLARRKETALYSDFFREVLGEALSYATSVQNPALYELEPQFSVPEVGTADAALGLFRPGEALRPLAVVELKGPRVQLDRDKFNGRTAVQQCWDYLNALPDCPWGIVSNFVTFRLYHRAKTPLAYEEFTLQELREPRRFRQFYCIFERGGLVRPARGQPLRAPRLLELTENRQREVGDELYQQYSQNRLRLLEHLHLKQGKPLDEAIHIAQKILDRIVFVAFCEDRGLLPAKCIDRAYGTIPPFSKVVNPRWQNFLNLFAAVDRGHRDLVELETGYDGGLFAHDPAVDDLQLDDDWTHFFRAIGSYDFRDEVNVDVLGHLFENSVAELERVRTTGLFGANPSGAAPSGGAAPAMQKSAERKRFGIFYTPPEFTRDIIHRTVGAAVDDRIAAVRAAHGLAETAVIAVKPSPALAAYWRDCFAALRTIAVCDPACGSGAFLIQAYDLLEDRYHQIVDQLLVHDPAAADELAATVPEAILADNLYGVDLSPQAVEITQLALWVRSAQRNKTLADLSHNILRGNSLVEDPTVHPRAFRWEDAFPRVFGRPEGPGFDCVVGNPPWERLKVQEREFFAFSAPEIAGAISAAQRRRLISQLEEKDPELFARYTAAQTEAARTLDYARRSGRYPLTGRGDVNTYMLFAELAGRIVAPRGRVGLLVPSGIATDHTTRAFFSDLVERQALAALYDFENRRRVFPDVDGRFKFSILVFTGRGGQEPETDFAFFLHAVDDLDDPRRHIRLTARDFALLNPNTRTCPIFRTRRDAELTRAIYRRVPVLIDESRQAGGNPWGIRYVRMFDQTSDAELFRTAAELADQGFKRDGNRWRKRREVFLPLYEAKMVQAYDHRAASVVVAAGNWVRQGQTEPTTLVLHQNPEFVVQPRWWVAEGEVARVLGEPIPAGFIGFKDITSPTNQRTVIAAAIPWSAVTNHFPLLLHTATPRRGICLLANLNSRVLDYMARQKIGGITLNFFIVNQLPLFGPERYDERCPWQPRQKLEKWIAERALKLTCTADDLRPLAEAAGLDPPVHRWNPAERAELLAELDAAFFLLYGLDRDEVEYVLGTFAAPREEAEAALWPGRHDVLEVYDRLRAAE